MMLCLTFCAVSARFDSSSLNRSSIVLTAESGSAGGPGWGDAAGLEVPGGAWLSAVDMAANRWTSVPGTLRSNSSPT